MLAVKNKEKLYFQGSGMSSFLYCELQGPIKTNKKRLVSVDFDVSSLYGGQQTLDFNNFEVFSTSGKMNDINLGNNRSK